MLKDSIRIAAVYVGAIIGAGFASGQEVLQYFTYYGWIGLAGIALATIIFSGLGYQITKIGSALQTTSHKNVIRTIGGKYFGTAVDYIIILACLNATVVMIAGGGALLHQLFDFPVFLGSGLVALLIAGTLCLNLQQIINVIGSVTPFLILMAMILAIYSIFTSDVTAAQIQAQAKPELTASPHWALSAILYVSYNVIMAVAILSVVGGSIKDSKVAGMGGILGGLGLGLLLLILNAGMMVKLDHVSAVEMPTLLLATDITPWLAIVMGLTIFLMIFNTGASALYAFATRLVNPSHHKFKLIVVSLTIVAYILSFIGFSTLVGKAYPLFGYLGLLLIVIVFVQWIRVKMGKDITSTSIEKTS